MRHCLGLATRIQISVCKSSFPSAGTAVSLFRAKTVQQRPLLPREVETRLFTICLQWRHYDKVWRRITSYNAKLEIAVFGTNNSTINSVNIQYFLIKFCVLIAKYFTIITCKCYLNRLRFSYFIMKHGKVAVFLGYTARSGIFIITPYGSTRRTQIQSIKMQ